MWIDEVRAQARAERAEQDAIAEVREERAWARFTGEELFEAVGSLVDFPNFDALEKQYGTEQIERDRAEWLTLGVVIAPKLERKKYEFLIERALQSL